MKVLGTIFIQPTYQCALNCKGCYVKESVHGPEMSQAVLESFIRFIWVTPQFSVSQITLAVDDLPEDKVAREKMISALSTVLRMRKLYGNKIELHLTLNSLSTLDKYVDSGLSLGYIAKHVDLMSISHLTRDDVPLIRELRNFTKINYNYMPTKTLSGYQEMLKHVDMSYYLLYKTGLGRRNDPLAIETFKEGLKRIASWDTSEKRKIVVDGCVRDSFKFFKTGFGCSSNVSRFHLWPDGHVTGCAYNKDGGRTSATLQGILQEFHRAAMVYEFRSCTVPRDYASLHASSLRVIQ